MGDLDDVEFVDALSRLMREERGEKVIEKRDERRLDIEGRDVLL